MLGKVTSMLPASCIHLHYDKKGRVVRAKTRACARASHMTEVGVEAMAGVLKQFLLISQCPRCGSALLSSSKKIRKASSFPPSRVVVVRKTTRLEYEHNRNGLTTEQELRNRVWEWDTPWEWIPTGLGGP